MYTRVVVPLDGSETAEEVLDEAISLAKLNGAELHLVRVADSRTLEQIGGEGMMWDAATIGSLLDEEEQASGAYLNEVAERLTSENVEATTETLRGSVVNSLLSVAKPGDMIAIATHGRSGLKRWFLGSVAEELVRRATVPLLIVRAQRAEAETAA
jgi:nucleotide-binding universal stress UspA family protein